MSCIKYLSLFCFLSIFFNISLKAEEPAAELEIKAFQVSLITPLGTNGLDSWNIINKFSLNAITGYAGGISGAEFSGFGSILKTDMKGAQFSGFGNIVLGETYGAQFSGFINIPCPYWYPTFKYCEV